MAIALFQVEVRKDDKGVLQGVIRDLRTADDQLEKTKGKLSGFQKWMAQAFDMKPVKELRGHIDSAAGSVGQFASSFGPVGVALTAVIGAATLAVGVLGSLGAMTGRFVGYADQIATMAVATHTSTTALQEWRLAAAKSNTDLEAVARTASKMQVELVKSPEAFAAIGLRVNELRAMAPDQLLTSVAQALAGIESPTLQAAAAAGILGRDYRQVLPFLLSDLGATVDRSRELGLVLDDSVIQKGSAMDDALTEAKLAFEGLLVNMGSTIGRSPELIQAIEDVATALGKVSTWVQEHGDDISKWIDRAVTVGRGLAQPTMDVLGFAGNYADYLAITSGHGPIFAGSGKAPAPREAEPKGSAGEIAALAEKANAQIKAAFGAGKYKEALEEVIKQEKILATLGASDAVKGWRERIEAAKKYSDELKKARAHWSGAAAQKEMEQLVKEVGNLKNVAPQLVGELVAKVQKLVDAGAEIPEPFYELGDALEKAGPPAEQLAQALLKIPTGKNYGPSGFGSGVYVEGDKPASGIRTATSATMDWSRAVSTLADTFQLLGQTADTSLGRVLVGLASGLSTMSQLQSYARQFKDANGNAANSLSAAWGQMDQASQLQASLMVAQSAYSIYAQNTRNRSTSSAVMSGAVQGASVGAMFGPEGAAIGAVAGGAIGYFASKDYAHAVEKAGQILGHEVSDALAEAIISTSKQFGGSLKIGALLQLSAAMDEAVAKGGSYREFASQTVELLNLIESGAVPAAKGLGVVGEAFSKIAAEAMKADIAGDHALRNIIRRARASGLDSPEIKAFLREQMESAAAGLAKAFAVAREADPDRGIARGQSLGIAMTDEQSARDQGTIFAVTFWAAVEEQGYVAAADAMRGTFETLKEGMAAWLSPEDLEAVMGPIERIMNLTESSAGFRAATEGAKGLADVLAGLTNSDIPLTVDQFSAFERQAEAARQQAIAGGATEAESYLAIAPLLQRLVEASRSYGIELDAETAAMIEQAEAAGVAFKVDPFDRAAEAMERVASVLERIYGLTGDAASGFDQMGESAERSGRRFPAGGPPGSPITYWPDTGDPLYGPESIPEFAHGGIAHGPASGYLARLHGTEVVVPLDRFRAGGRLVDPWGEGGPGSSGGGGSTPPPTSWSTGGNTTIPTGSWGGGPAVPVQIQQLSEQVAQLAEAVARQQPVTVVSSPTINVQGGADPATGQSVAAVAVEGVKSALWNHDADLEYLVRRAVEARG